MTQPSNVVPLPVRAPTAATITFCRGDEVEFADQLVKRISVDGPVTSDEGEVWTYRRSQGIWEVVSRAELITTVASFAGCPIATPRPRLLTVSDRAINGAIKIAMAALESSPNRDRFENGFQGIAFRNCFLRTEGGVIKAAHHTPYHMARHRFGFDYDPSAPHPRFDQFLADVFADAQPWDAAERIRVLQEFVGACLVGRATGLQQALVLYGSGNNGKSAFLEMAEAVFPDGSTCALPPQDWGSRFRTASLVGKLANIVNEIPEGEIVASALFKSVISGEPVQGEHKMRTPFTFRPTAGHMFSANSLPATSDQSKGFWRRFIVIPFSRDMTSAPNRQPNIAEHIVGSELAGIVAWAVEGALRVIAQGAYSHCQASDDAIRRWRLEVDPVLCFFDERCLLDPNAQMPASVLYVAFKTWALDNGFRQVSSTKFGRRLRLIGVPSMHTRSGSVYPVAFRSTP